MKRLFHHLYYLVAILPLSNCVNLSDSAPVYISNHNDAHYRKSVKTWKDLSENNIVMQKFDYSCGAAALATLMQYYFQDPVGEKKILSNITKQMNQTVIKNRKKEGLSLLDLQQFSQRRGYQAVGVKLKFSTLKKLQGPILVHVKTREFKHFAVLRGIKDDRVFLADPSRGNIRMSIDKFSKEWQGVALVLGKKGFVPSKQHALVIKEQFPVVNELKSARQGLYISY